MAERTNQPPIYFTSLELKNVRCFGDHQTLDLTDDEGRLAQWTLLLGDNGVGKTTLLQCLAWMRPVPASNSPENDQPDTVEPALDSEQNEVWNSLLRRQDEVQLELEAALSVGQTLGKPQKSGAQKNIETGVQMSGKDGVLQKRELIPSTGPFPDLLNMTLGDLTKRELIPLFVYWADRSMGIKNLENHSLSDPLASLSSCSTELYDAEEILLNFHYRAAISEEHREQQNKKRLQQVKQVLADVLPDIQDEADIRILGPKVLGHPDEPSGVRFITPYGLVPLSGLSLGYQTTLAWTVDLASRLYERYPDSPNPLSEPAIVLIDEIDLHLHPRWQRKIMDDLTHHFPKTQFIATAHSPLMVQAATNANLAVLNQNDSQVVIQNRPQFVKAWRVDQILASGLFDIPARSKEIECLIADRDRLLAKGGTLDTSEEKCLKELDKKLENLPTAEIQEDQADMDLIRRMAAKLREQFPDS